VILELVGAPKLKTDIESLAIGARLSTIGIGAGARAEIDIRQLMSRRARIFSSTLRPRPLEERAIGARLVESQVIPVVVAGRLEAPAMRISLSPRSNRRTPCSPPEPTWARSSSASPPAHRRVEICNRAVLHSLPRSASGKSAVPAAAVPVCHNAEPQAFDLGHFMPGIFHV
jgi:hypothetical protein